MMKRITLFLFLSILFGIGPTLPAHAGEKCSSMEMTCPANFNKNWNTDKGVLKDDVFFKLSYCDYEKLDNEVKRKCDRIRCKKPGPKLDDGTFYISQHNGCSTQDVEQLPLVKGYSNYFKPACDAHDLCYGTPGVSRSDCDNIFHENMNKLCYSTNLTWRPSGENSTKSRAASRQRTIVDCKVYAGAFYAAVNSKGGKYFSAAQDLAHVNGCVAGRQ